MGLNGGLEKGDLLRLGKGGGGGVGGRWEVIVCKYSVWGGMGFGL